MGSTGKIHLKISVLMWADILVEYALFVMQNYLTDVWKISLTHAAGLLNIWEGISRVLTSFFLFLVDALLGNFMMVVVSSIVYSLGIVFVAMSTPPVLGTCKEYEPQCIGLTQKVLFYMGMPLLAVGISGHLVSVFPFLWEQEDIPWDEANNVYWVALPRIILLVLMPVTGTFALPYIKSWTVLFGVPAILSAVATLVFLSGWSAFRKEEPKGSPFTNMCRVFVASASKKSVPFPDDEKQLYKKNNLEPPSFYRTPFLRWLEKAAIILPDAKLEDQVKNRWKLCSVAQVEEAKRVVHMLPICVTFIVCGIVSSIGNSYFTEQASNLNRKVGKWKVPVQLLFLLYSWTNQVLKICASLFVRRFRTYGPQIGTAIAMIFSIVCCIVAAVIESWRLRIIRNNGLLQKPDEKIPLSIYWLSFQFFLLGGLNSFFEESVAGFYEDQAPESMRFHLRYVAKGVTGLGYMCGVLSVHVVGRISEKVGKENWFQYTLNRSRLDRYYWVLAALSSVNLLLFIVLATTYAYKTRKFLRITREFLKAQDDDIVGVEGLCVLPRIEGDGKVQWCSNHYSPNE